MTNHRVPAKEISVSQVIEASQTTPSEITSRAPGIQKPSMQALAGFNLRKSYGRRCVVDNVTVHVEPGEVVGLLGANGAGKTTTFYMVIGLETPEAGRVLLAG